MRHWTLRDVVKLKIDNSQVPAPFPGRWPTRIAWIVMHNGKLRGEYFGKPNREQLQRLLKLSRNAEALALEFDLKHLIAQFVQPVGGLSVARLYDAYHPWTKPQAWLGHFSGPVFLKNIGGFRCYSPVNPLPRAYIEKYKVWMLDFCGRKLMSAEERAAAKAERLRMLRLQREGVRGQRPRRHAAYFNEPLQAGELQVGRAQAQFDIPDGVILELPAGFHLNANGWLEHDE